MDHVQVVSRNAIPPIRDDGQGQERDHLGELRDFSLNDQLRSFMPAPSTLSVSWVRLEQGEVLEPHAVQNQSMMIFYAGSGHILGDLQRPVSRDDVVVVPGGCQQGFLAGPDGLCALSIQFGLACAPAAKKPRVVVTSRQRTLSGLMEYNRERLEMFLGHRIFRLLRDGTFKTVEKRHAFLGALRIWAVGYQTMLVARQGSCVDPSYAPVFLQSLQAVLAHDEVGQSLLAHALPDAPMVRDTTIEATTNWFVYQMYALDNAEKFALTHLVVQQANSALFREAMVSLTDFATCDHLELRDEPSDSPELGRLVAELLEDEAPAAFQRLHRVVAEGWNMIGAMTDRLVERT